MRKKERERWLWKLNTKMEKHRMLCALSFSLSLLNKLHLKENRLLIIRYPRRRTVHLQEESSEEGTGMREDGDVAAADCCCYSYYYYDYCVQQMRSL